MGHRSALFGHKRAARVLGILLGASAVWIIAGRPVAAQDFGRTAATGDWTDSFWVDFFGVVGALPASGADVFIGGAGAPHPSALGTAAVNLSGTRSARNVTIGPQPGDNGMLTIQSGGNLSLVQLLLGGVGGTVAGHGELSVESGGMLTATSSLCAACGGGSATINLNGGTVSVQTYLQGGPVTVNRSGGGIQATFFAIQGGDFIIAAGDSFSSVSVSNGGATASNIVATSFGGLQLGGMGSYTANAPLMVGFLQVFSDSEFNANANVTSTGFSGIDGALNLNAGTFTATTTVEVGSGGVTNAQNNVGLNANLSIGAGGALNVFQSVREGDGLTFQGNNLTIDPAGSMSLHFDDTPGTGPIDFAFRWTGEHVSTLQGLLGTRITASGAATPVSVIYDPAKYDDFTYIGFVPLLGDFDGDNDFDSADYLNLSTHLLTDVSALNAFDSYALGDLNGDRRINGADYVAFRTSYDQVNGSGAFTAMLASVPEPASAMLAMGVAIVGLVRLRLVRSPEALC